MSARDVIGLLRRVRESRYKDTVRVERVTAREFSPVTNEYVDTTVVVYEGPALARPKTIRVTQFGDTQRLRGVCEVQFPHSAPSGGDFRIDDRATFTAVTSVADIGLVGAAMTIKEVVDYDSYATHRAVVAERDVTEPPVAYTTTGDGGGGG